MYSIEFKADIVNGVVHIPSKYIELQEKKNAKFFVLIEDNKKDFDNNKLSSISLDTLNYKFNREEANER